MIKIEKTQVVGLEAAIRGMRNPMNSWSKSDSVFDIRPYEESDGYYTELAAHGIDGKLKVSDKPNHYDDNEKDYSESWAKEWYYDDGADYGSDWIGPNDLDLMKRLAKNGSVHAKYRRMIIVYCDITAPLYWWKEFDTYKVGTVANSCSTMHKIQEKEFTLEDFSHEHLINIEDCGDDWHGLVIDGFGYQASTKGILGLVVDVLNYYRKKFLETKDKRYWWQMIQLLPSSYNQKRTVMLNYEVLAGIYPMRKDHKLDEWHTFCDWIKALPYSELITLEFEDEKKEKPALDSIDDIHVHLPKNSGRYPWGKKED